MKPYNQTDPKKEQIRDMFDGIAPKYDMLNHLMSLNIDKSWRRKLVKMLAEESPERVLDLATGTGDLAIAIARRIPNVTIDAVDLSPQMLEIAKVKVKEFGLGERITTSVGEAENLTFDEGTFDAATVAFGVRNYHNLELGIAQMHHVLKTGGAIFVLEFSTPRSKIFGTLFRFYFHKILPFVGGWFSKDMEAYKYLPESVDEFPSPDNFEALLKNTGFTNTSRRSLFGGVAYIYKGIK